MSAATPARPLATLTLPPARAAELFQHMSTTMLMRRAVNGSAAERFAYARLLRAAANELEQGHPLVRMRDCVIDPAIARGLAHFWRNVAAEADRLGAQHAARDANAAADRAVLPTVPT